MARTSLLKGLVGGAVATAVLGLLLSPKTTKEVQQSIRQQVTKFQHKFAKKPSLDSNETLQAQGSVANFSTTPPPLTITKVTPNSGPCYKPGMPLTIVGTGLVGTPSVTFGGMATVVVPFTGIASEIKVFAPANLPGFVDLIVKNPDGQTATLTNAYAYKSTLASLDS